MRLRPERGDGVKPAGGRPPRESAWGCPPPLVPRSLRDQLWRGLAVARVIDLRAKAEGPTRRKK